MTDIQISHLFGSYPDLDNNPQFIAQLSAKQEFAELPSQIKEQAPRPGQYYPHQIFAARLINNFVSNFLVIDDPGTGKSCLITLASETFKAEYLKSPDDPTKIKRGVILVKNVTLFTNIRTNILCYCTDGDYITDKIRAQTETNAMQQAITDSLRTFYDIMTYSQFFDKLEKYQREEDRVNYMSNKIFFLDEGHNLIKGQTLAGDKDFETEEELMEDEEMATKTTYDNLDDNHYRTFHRLFHTGHQNRFIILTATPMINTPLAFSYLMNLILPLKALTRQNIEDYVDLFKSKPQLLDIDYTIYRDIQAAALDRYALPRVNVNLATLITALGQLNIDSATVDTLVNNRPAWLVPWWVYQELQNAGASTNASIVEVEATLTNISGQMPNYKKEYELDGLDFQYYNRYLNGRVLYTRALDIGIDVKYMENPGIPNREGVSHLLYFCPMSVRQYMVYYKNIIATKAKQDFRVKAKQISTLIYPNDAFGQKGIKGYMTLDSSTKAYTIDRSSADGKELLSLYRVDLRDPEASALHDLSCKFWLIVTKCLQSYTDAPTTALGNTSGVTGGGAGGTTRPVPNDKGVIFCFDPDFLHGSGAADLALMLVVNGYELFNDVRSIFIDEGVDEDGNVITRSISPCPSSNSLIGAKKKTTRSKIGAKKRVSLLSGSTKPTQQSAILNSVNAPENIYGQYLQVIIASMVAKEAISVNHVVKGFIIRGPWNQSNLTQALNRFQRSNSHIQRLMNMINVDAEGNRIDKFPVEIYLLAAIYVSDPDLDTVEPGSQLGNLILQYGGTFDEDRGYDIDPVVLRELFEQHADIPVPEDLQVYKNNLYLLEDNYDTVDTYLYNVVSRKDEKIRRIMRFCRMSAANCLVNYQRNVRSTDRDDSAECDYGNCQYLCSGCTEKGLPADWINQINGVTGVSAAAADSKAISNSLDINNLRINGVLRLDESTKILNYSQNEIYLAKVNIQKLLQDHIAIQLDELVKLIGMKSQYVYEALTQMINGNDIVLNKNGYYCYIRDRADGLIYLQRDFFAKDSDPYYNQLFINQSRLADLFIDYAAEFGYQQQAGLIEDVFALNDADEETLATDLPVLIERLTLLNKVQVLERVIERKFIEGFTSNVGEYIIDYFNYAIYTLPEPREKIQQENAYYKNRKQGKAVQGGGAYAPTTEVSKMRLSQAMKTQRQRGKKEEGEIVGEMVVLHSLLRDTSSSKTTGRLRLLKADEGRWRDLTPAETVVYVVATQLMKKDEDNRFESEPVYGVQMPPLNQFKIRDVRVSSKKVKEDARYDRDGKQCKFWTYPDLIELCVRLNIPYPVEDDWEAIVDALRDTGLSDIRINNMSDQQLKQQFSTVPTMITFMRKQLTDLGYPDVNSLRGLQLYSTYMWYFSKLDIDQLCAVLYDFFLEHGKLKTGVIPNKLNEISKQLKGERDVVLAEESGGGGDAEEEEEVGGEEAE